MKKALIAALACASLAVARSSYGSGVVFFDNYASTPYMPIMLDTGSKFVGLADSNYHVDLLYVFGTQSTTNGMLDTGLSVAINSALVDSFGNHGYFQGGVVTIPGYVSGPVSFDIVCWLAVTEGFNQGYANYGLSSENSFDNGQSRVFTESSLATGQMPPNFFAALPNDTGGPDTNGAPLLIIGSPEPSTFALTGLGFVALVLRRRHKK